MAKQQQEPAKKLEDNDERRREQRQEHHQYQSGQQNQQKEDQLPIQQQYRHKQENHAENNRLSQDILSEILPISYVQQTQEQQPSSPPSPSSPQPQLQREKSQRDDLDIDVEREHDLTPRTSPTQRQTWSNLPIPVVHAHILPLPVDNHQGEWKLPRRQGGVENLRAEYLGSSTSREGDTKSRFPGDNLEEEAECRI